MDLTKVETRDLIAEIERRNNAVMLWTLNDIDLETYNAKGLRLSNYEKLELIKCVLNGDIAGEAIGLEIRQDVEKYIEFKNSIVRYLTSRYHSVIESGGDITVEMDDADVTIPKECILDYFLEKGITFNFELDYSWVDSTITILQ